MPSVIRRRSTCRLCGSASLERVLALAPTPLANAFVTQAELGTEQPLFPLDLWLCGGCGHVQLLDVVDPKVLFENYLYVSGTSPAFVKHFQSYADYVIGTFDPPPHALVVEIGSNDGTLLRFFQGVGRKVLGVEPAREIAEASRAAGIPTLTGFFTPEIAERILAEHGPAAVVAANNVIAHIDDLGSVMHGIERLLAPDGVFVFEVSYLVDVLQKTLFDTIYHEHLDYHSVEPLIPYLAAHGLELIEAQRVDTHGGSLRGVAQKAGGRRKPGASVAAALNEEQALRLRDARTYTSFGKHIGALGNQLTSELHRLRHDGKRIAGFGAPAKATTMMYHLGIAPGTLEFIVDDSPLKQGRYSPGMHIPVVPAQALYEQKPDYALILAWNFAKPIIARHQAFRDAGGRFIVPLPAFEVV